jgi:hypothetical protein
MGVKIVKTGKERWEVCSAVLQFCSSNVDEKALIINRIPIFNLISKINFIYNI